MQNDYNSFNQTILIGRIGKDPELKRSKGKNPQDFVKFSVATYMRFSSGNKSTTWHQCSYWGDTRAAWAQKYVKKGMLMLIVGKYENRTWKTADGQPHKITEMKVDFIGFMGAASDIAKMDNREEIAKEEQSKQQAVDNVPDPQAQGDPGMGQITDQEEDAQKPADEEIPFEF